MPPPTRADLRAVALFAEQLEDPTTRQEAVWSWNQALYDHHIIDLDYSIDEGRHLIGRALGDRTFIADADLASVRTMATFLARAERFCDGWLAESATNGVALALTRRLGDLADALPTDTAST